MCPFYMCLSVWLCQIKLCHMRLQALCMVCYSEKSNLFTSIVVPSQNFRNTRRFSSNPHSCSCSFHLNQMNWFTILTSSMCCVTSLLVKKNSPWPQLDRYIKYLINVVMSCYVDFFAVYHESKLPAVLTCETYIPHTTHSYPESVQPNWQKLRLKCLLGEFFCMYKMGTYFIFCNYFSAVQKFYLKKYPVW